MISILAIFVTLTNLGLSVMQSVFVFSYQSFLRHGHRAAGQNAAPRRDSDDLANTESESYQPKTAVVLCLRGETDPIVDCLMGITSQAYDNYELHVVFDDVNDPAKDVVDSFFSKGQIQPTIHTFEPLPNCSLKCSAIVHAVSSLPDSIEVVAFIDADTIVDPNWLTDLVTPLHDPSIGATTGNRWFTPEPSPDYSLVQKVWNAAAVVQMYSYQIAWGGSLALRREVIETCGLLDEWSKTFCEDTILSKVFMRNGLRLHRVHNLVIDNKEPANSKNTFRWIVRQLTTVKLHHTRWSEVLLHGILTGITCIVAPILFILLLLSGHIDSAMAVLKSWLVYQAVNLGLLWTIGQSNREIVASREESSRTESQFKPSIFDEFKAIMLTQILHPIATLKAWLSNQVDWRGVQYGTFGGTVRVLNIPSSRKVAEEEIVETFDPNIIPMQRNA